MANKNSVCLIKTNPKQKSQYDSRRNHGLAAVAMNVTFPLVLNVFILPPCLHYVFMLFVRPILVNQTSQEHLQRTSSDLAQRSAWTHG